MECDIHTIVEFKTPKDDWMAIVFKEQQEIFCKRNYKLFGFLANVRNHMNVPNPWPPRDWPNDVTEYAIERSASYAGDVHTYSWLSLEELLAFDYDTQFKIYSNGLGVETTYHQLLGQDFFNDLERLKAIGHEVRILFFFNN